MKRRDFIANAAALGIGAAGANAAREGAKPRERLPSRPYGTTGRELSIIGLGGIVVKGVEQSEANDTVAWAIDRGVSYFDVAPTYGDAQDRLGPALGLEDVLLLLGLRTQDGGLLVALGVQNFGATFTLGLHLLLHGVLNFCWRRDVAQLHAIHLGTPLVRSVIQDLL